MATDYTHARRRALFVWLAATTLLAEAVTLYLRFHTGMSAAEFNKDAPLLMQIHHMFWGVPLLPVAVWLWRKPRVAGTLLGIAGGLLLSDLLHHFVILPLLVGNTGWHWP
jgi:hypothetical protein